jgi:23S rRNA pseudouridine1911/1915/1917 synthase
VAKPDHIELPTGERIAILYEDRSVIAIDKPRDWMLVPFSWQKTNRNLQAALTSSIAAGEFWARSRGLRFLRFVHRLDAETTGILLLAKSQGAVASYGALFESREMEKVYLAVIAGVPKQTEWSCRMKIGQDSSERGRMKVDARHGKDAETHFRVLQTGENTSLVEAHPYTGRTHQIRVHLAASGHPVVGDVLYGVLSAGGEVGPGRETRRGGDTAPYQRGKGRARCPHRAANGTGAAKGQSPVSRPNLGLRAVALAYVDPFTRRRVQIRAPIEAFVREYGFELPKI